MNILSVRHTYPEKAGFCIDRKNGCDSFTFLHFHNSVEVVTNGKKTKTTPHAVILYSPKEPQYFISSEPLIHDWLHFNADLDGLAFKNFTCDEVFYPKSFSFITEIVSEMENEFFNSRHNREEMLNVMLKGLLIKLDRSVEESEMDRSAISPDVEAQFRNFRCELFSSLDERWTVSDMAKKLNFSQSRFLVLYKTIFGISPIADLINARINSAKNKLVLQHEKIEDIAASLGYQNVTHFIRQFKASTGTTPNNYRKNAQSR